ncbi:MAG: hypothetical protein M1822_009166 [Bathelium mastoideum]|nr:MAG: hypothetical protein M1822_009166 [Bathelium mastoideum]
MAAHDYFTRKISTGRIRTPIAPSAPAGSSPTTPQSPFLGRSFSSALNSPSATFRSTDDEPLLIEIGSRYLRAGLAGERAPRCVFDFSPNEQRRVGDYRQWLPRRQQTGKFDVDRSKHFWGHDHELWRMDLGQVDLALVEDKIERAVRVASTKYLMETAQKPRRIFLALPPMLPHPLLSAVLATLFSKALAPTITIFPTPVLNTVAAGLRSALVIDIGWAETIITGVYEYREVHQKRSDRAGKVLCQEFGALLDAEIERRHGVADEDKASHHPVHRITFEQAEEVMTRIGWCQSADQTHAQRVGLKTHASGGGAARSSTVHIPLRASHPDETLEMPFHRLAEPVEVAWFGQNTKPKELDDNEQPLPELAFQVLCALALDIRGTCMSRVIVTGGGSRLPGIKRRLVKEIEALLHRRGWDPVRDFGSAAEKSNRVQRVARANLQSHPDTGPMPKINEKIGEGAGVSTIPSGDPQTTAVVEEAHTDQVHDLIAGKLARERAKAMKPSVQGVIRGVETLGAFSGLSLLASTSLHVRGAVECDRDTFLLHGGLTSASKAKDVVASQASQRQSLGPSAGGGNRSSWTLGGWA